MLMKRFAGTVKHWILSVILLGCWVMIVPAQLQRSCGTHSHMESLMQSYPQMRQTIKGIENHRLMISKGSFNGIRGEIVIPVVVHVVYNTDQQNISDAQVLSQIKVLNQDFQRRNPDKDLTPDIFKPRAANARIRFELAKIDPAGNPTTGITRTQTRKTSFFTNTNGVKYSAMGGVDVWAPDQYLNIWVCPLAMGVLGYAQFPGGPKETDGVVINYKAFGTRGTVFGPFNLGRTTTHEVGHWLNLKHISGDGGCDVDDEVEDTPLCSRQHYGCMEGAMSCEGEDMVSNFMDYSDDKCMNLFTIGQAERMRALFAPGGFRHSLTRSQGLTPPIPVVEVKAPETIDVNALTSSSAYISWADVEGANAYRLQLRKADRPNWLTKVSSKTFISAIKLEPCTSYEVRLSAIFKEDESTFAEPIIFTTEGCSQGVQGEDQLRVPGTFDPPVLSRQTATLAWEPIPGATGYKVQYKISKEQGVRTASVSHPSVTLKDLRRGAKYIYRVRALFADEAGAYSKVQSFWMDGFAALRVSQTANFEDDEWVRAFIEPHSKVVRLQFEEGTADQVEVTVYNYNKEAVIRPQFYTVGKDHFVTVQFDQLMGGPFMLRIKDPTHGNQDFPMDFR